MLPVQSPLCPVPRPWSNMLKASASYSCACLLREGTSLLPQALQHSLRCSLSAELEAAHLCNGGLGGKQAEVAGLMLAVMAERCLGMASRSAQGQLLSSAAEAS